MSEILTMPLVSICMPVYNAEQYLLETLTRLSEQSYPYIEVIVVDDHSTDSSLEIAASYPSEQVKVFTNPGKGACSARNYAFAQATGAYIKFMDADDYCSPNLIGKQVESLLAANENTVVFSPLKMLFPDGSLLEPKRSIDCNYGYAFDLQIDILKRSGFNCPHCYLMPHGLVEQVGGWDEAILKNQDGEYFSRVLAIAESAVSISDEFAVWRQTGTGISSAMSREALLSMVESYQKIFKLSISKQNTEEMRKICGAYMGLFVYTQYPHIQPIMGRIQEILTEIDAPLILPGRRVLKTLKFFLGWKSSVALIHRLGI